MPGQRRTSPAHPSGDQAENPPEPDRPLPVWQARPRIKRPSAAKPKLGPTNGSSMSGRRAGIRVRTASASCPRRSVSPFPASMRTATPGRLSSAQKTVQSRSSRCKTACSMAEGLQPGAATAAAVLRPSAGADHSVLEPRYRQSDRLPQARKEPRVEVEAGTTARWRCSLAGMADHFVDRVERRCFSRIAHFGEDGG